MARVAVGEPVGGGSSDHTRLEGPVNPRPDSKERWERPSRADDRDGDHPLSIRRNPAGLPAAEMERRRASYGADVDRIGSVGGGAVFREDHRAAVAREIVENGNVEPAEVLFPVPVD